MKRAFAGKSSSASGYRLAKARSRSAAARAQLGAEEQTVVSGPRPRTAHRAAIDRELGCNPPVRYRRNKGERDAVTGDPRKASSRGPEKDEHLIARRNSRARNFLERRLQAAGRRAAQE